MMLLDVLLGTAGAIYLVFLNKRVSGPNNSAREAPSPLTLALLDEASYADIDLTEGIPPATHKGYAIIGGSGFLGTYLIRLLLLRGEMNIRVVDLNPPEAVISSQAAVSFVRADITDPVSIRDALLQPFNEIGSPPTVIYHTAALIRFWERSYYSWHLSYRVNVLGTRNVVAAAKEIPGATLIYTSTADAIIHSTKFCRLGLDGKYPPWNKHVISDDDPPLGPWEQHESCYARSKVLAERLIIGANGQSGLKTGIIRPGHTIVGPNDRLCTSTLSMPRVPNFGKRYRHTNICVWDAVSAHLLLENALDRVPEEAAGQAYLVTGKGPAWSIGNIRAAIKHISNRPLIFDNIPELLVLILAHVIEALLFIRYHILLPFYLAVGTSPRPEPRWMGESVYLQPATLEFMADITIDDSRARRVLGYMPKWAPEQWIKYAVDEVSSGRTHTGHGLQLK
ncbi:NAD(P)-binding protein, partial [Gyrodon lividus]